MPPIRRRRHLRHAAALLATALAVPTALSIAATAPAHADDSHTLTVVGTSDVNDSGLVPNVLKPGFEAYEQSLGKQVTFNYVPQGTGAAITTAESGTASALIVHAASLENQFVAGGFSLEPYGRAFTWGDFVLLGPTADPAGVETGGQPSGDIVDAYEKVAAAGLAGNADFVSRGSTPGTTVAEHGIWALTSGVPTCAISTANGGGTSPVAATPSGTCGTAADSPPWYKVNPGNQAANVQASNACNFDSPHKDDCYVFTDKGTFQYLRSQGLVGNLKIVAQNNTVPGQENLLINSFHAYAINPAAFADDPNVQLNTAAATDFLNWVTSPAAQTAIGNYLATDPDHAPFRPSAAPVLSVADVPNPNGVTTVDAGTQLTFTGTLVNATPGTPSLSHVPVKLLARPASDGGAVPVQVASGTTDSNGLYTINYTPKSSLSYSVATDKITKIENSTLDPVFGDILAPATSQAGAVQVRGAITTTSASAGGKKGVIKLAGTLAPAAAAGAPAVALYAAKPGNKLVLRKSVAIPVGGHSYSFKCTLKSGKYSYQLRYVNPGVILSASTATKTLSLR